MTRLGYVADDLWSLAEIGSHGGAETRRKDRRGKRMAKSFPGPGKILGQKEKAGGGEPGNRIVGDRAGNQDVGRSVRSGWTVRISKNR